MGVLKKKKVTTLNNPYIHYQEKKEKLNAEHKKKLVRRLSIFGTLALMVIGVMVSTLISQHSRLEAKKQEEVRLEKSLAKYKQQETLLNEELTKLNDEEYIAKLARKDYFLSGKGEVIFNIPESKNKAKKDKESSY
ncbi:cell division protein DivIC [Oikeobacillus pervagus]|uniref:Cell division protein DivIC n=1 Tax=Oikeobacillus pervagus TaxID=1325931 RepID=A0AAJ1T6Q9_9BACI|nr:septum formation initiator family protein [Oikeobacillus pervagus]MDQ0216186.1 cell division protein DivIC [Oikeobacillus pervagus]